MANSGRDQNRVTTLSALSSADGVTIVPLYADPTTHRLLVDNAGTAGLEVGVTTITGGTDGRILFDDNGVLGEKTITGTGSVVLATSPTLVTPVLGVATATSVNGLTITASTGTLTLVNGSSLVTAGANSITLTSTGATNVTLPTTGTLATLAGSETLSNKTLTTPTIASFANATHNHQDAAGGGQLTDAALSAAVGIAKGGTGQTTATAAFDALAPTTTQGDLIYHNGTDNVRLAKGTAAQVLTMNAGATAPEWATAGGGGAWTLKSYTTTTATTISISGLNLDTDLSYKVIVMSDQGSSSSTQLWLRFNSVSTNSYQYVYWGYAAGAVAVSQTAQDRFNLYAANSENHMGEFMIFRRATVTDFVQIQGQTSGTNGGGDATRYGINFAGNAAITDNITDMTFLNNGFSTTWRVWVLKPNTA